ncbi:MAG: hypothetical protein KAY65_13210 [Planctomycetes bacterium]|nr:hypothetical protein [Planctomycetota bacterium]
MDSESPQARSCIRALKDIDFELAYLALLTCQGLKPLSRWEKPLDDTGFGSLQQMGLLTRQITRTVKTGKKVIETIFSRAPAYLELYEQRFANAPIDKSPETQRFEGFLFGYPPCCIEQYIRRPYTPNSLPDQDQKILFHWACKNCKITPTLLPPYKTIHNSLNTY